MLVGREITATVLVGREITATERAKKECTATWDKNRKNAQCSQELTRRESTVPKLTRRG
jgi:hypothetical protein